MSQQLLMQFLTEQVSAATNTSPYRDTVSSGLTHLRLHFMPFK